MLVLPAAGGGSDIGDGQSRLAIIRGVRLPAALVPWTELDKVLMRRAIARARAAMGTTWPNPAVGCVITQAGVVISEAATQPGGRPHAEAMALARAGSRAYGATAYVTFEPCAHYGRTPPCADALIVAGIRRVVIADGHDPDPRVSGRGVNRLRAAGI